MCEAVDYRSLPEPKPLAEAIEANRPMSALGQKQTLRGVRPMSALPPKADIGTQSRNVRFVPKADMAATSALR